ncbi:hypothetical protein vseg_019288 [Gypsophila vaccaria]
MADAQLSRIIVQALASATGGIAGVGARGGARGGSGGGGGVVACTAVSVDRPESVVARLPETPAEVVSPEVQVVKRKRGRPPRTPSSAAATVASTAAAAAAVASKRSRQEEEDVCFICFDGGSLVMCDRRDCPKAYHPACVKREESFFRPNIRWTCGWHLCNVCQRNALFMCFTCPYSVCKSCAKGAEIYSIRGNKGFCKTCMSTIKLIEKIPQENKDVVQVDFDDAANWEYLFKMYWIYLKERETLTLDELLRASNPYRRSGIENKHTFPQKTHEPCSSNASEVSSSSAQWEANGSKRRNTGRQQQSLYVMDSQKIDKTESNMVSDLLGQPDWASKELLEFISHMKNGDTSVVPHFDVQALLLDYIRKNNLRDPRRKCQIICDKRLENLFGKDRVGHFEMLKLLEYHFKEESRTNGDIRGASMNLLSGPVEEGLTVETQIPSREARWKNRRKGDDKGRQINPDGYAAIDGHNINLIYLKRSLLETLTADAENFHDKVVGSVVRIKISSSDQKQDMHRLVRIIGTSQATNPYKVGGKIENLMLKILNLNKIEDISIDAISDQEFSEDECRRLRQSIKLGLVERLTVGEIQKKALALQAVRVDHWLETEITRLNLLRDRANEMGHRKEHREHVEKIELLKTPDERQRRIHEVPEVHADPRMDPSYGSDDDSGESDMKRRDGVLTTKYPKSHKDDRARSSIATAENRVRKGIPATKNHVGGVDGALGSSHSSQKTEIPEGALGVPKIDSRTDTSVVSSDQGVTTNGSNSQATSDHSTPNSRGMSLVSDVSELEKIWHYRDPAGKVQGPFCLLQLRKWDSSGFFPSDLRVWKMIETYDQSILLADALRNQQTSELQSHNGTKLDDENANSTGTMSSNSVAPWIGEQANEECSKSNSIDRASNPDANEQSVNGFSCQPESDGQCAADQLSVQNLKAQLIESLFNIEEPSVDNTVNQSPEMMHVDLKSDRLHSSCAMTTSDNVDANSQAVKSPTPSPDASKPDSGTSLPTASKEIEASEHPSSVPNSNYEMKDLNLDDELHDKPDVSKDSCASHGTESGATTVFNVPIPSQNKDNCHDAYKRHSANYGHEQDLGASSTVSGGISVSLFSSAVKKEDNKGLRSYIAENRHPNSANVLGGDSGTNWSPVSSGTDVSLLLSTAPNNENAKANTGETKYSVGSDIPKHDAGNRWNSFSSGFVVSSLPSTLPKMEPDGSKAPIIENGYASLNIPGQDSGVRFSDISAAIGSSDLTTPTLKLELDTSKGVALENNHCPPARVHGQDSCISWLEEEVHLPDVTGEWDWQPIELSTLGDESVSDLLSEVEAMESLRAMSSPSSRMICGDDSIVSPDVCFSPLGGMSPNIDPGKNDALTTSTDLQFHMLPNHRDQLHGSLSFHVDICDIPRTSCILSTLGLEPQSQGQPLPQPEVKLTCEPDLNFVSQAPLLSLLPPPSPPPPSVPVHNFFYQDPASLLSLPLHSPAPPLPPPQAEPSIPQLSATMCPSPPSAAPDLPLPTSAVSKLPSQPSVATKLPSTLSATTKSPSTQLAATKLLSPAATPKSPSLPSPPPPETKKRSSPTPSEPKKPPSPPPLEPQKRPSPLPSEPHEPPSPTPSKSKKPPSQPPLEPKKAPSAPPPETKKAPSAPLPVPKKAPSARKVPPVAANPPSIAPQPPETATKPLSTPSVAERPSLPPPRPSTLRVDFPSSPQEEGEVKSVVSVSSHDQRSLQTATTGNLRKQGSKPTTNGREQPGQPNGKFSGTGSILGSPTIHWSNPGQVMPPVPANVPWNPSVINPGTRVTSPRYNHNVGRHPGPKDRNHQHPAVDPGFAKNRPTSWNRQPPFGGNVPSRPPNRGTRVCKFYESGYCKRGASCKYLHP